MGSDLRADWLAGVKLAVIARRLGVSKSTAWRQVRALGLPKRRAGARPRVPDAELRRLHERGWSDNRIARWIGQWPPSVSRRLRRMELAANGRAS